MEKSPSKKQEEHHLCTNIHMTFYTHTHTYIYIHTTGPVIPKEEKNVCKVYMIKFYQVIWQGSMSRSFLFRPAKLCNEA